MDFDDQNLLVFFHEDSPVGYFEGESFPVLDGTYQYEPFRGSGHYTMEEKLNAGKPAMCYYDQGTDRIVFMVEKSDCRKLKVSGLKDGGRFVDR